MASLFNGSVDFLRGYEQCLLDLKYIFEDKSYSKETVSGIIQGRTILVRDRIDRELKKMEESQ